MELRKTLSVLAFATVVATGDLLLAQPRAAQPGVQVQVQPRQPAQPGQPGQRAGWQGNEQTLAACVAIENQAEVALSKWVMSKAKNEDVKDFADMLASDHEAFLKKLEKFTPEAREGSFTADQRTTATDENGVRPAGGAQPAQSGRIQQTAGQQSSNQTIDMIQLSREIAQQCLADTKKALNEKDADEFDKCFVGGQIVHHAAMQSKLTVLQKHASGELAQIFKDGIETVKSHQEEAEKLMKQLEKSSSKASE
jgi:predicted outer membrane protein